MDYVEEMAIKSLREYRELHELRIKELEISMKHVLERLHNLEEKERERAREKHQQEEALDFENSEGLGRV